MAIFLSVHKIEEVVEELKKGYSEDTPVVVVQKASWKEEVVVPGSLKDISKKVKEKNITKTAIILVGDFLGNKYSFSKLYNKNFSHGFREALK
jgi:precorrin-4/cobalt-precorrin-4 C11-methyltransferase